MSFPHSEKYVGDTNSVNSDMDSVSPGQEYFPQEYFSPLVHQMLEMAQSKGRSEKCDNFYDFFNLLSGTNFFNSRFFIPV